MGVMSQVWILLSAGAIWVMVQESKKADAIEYARKKVTENRKYMRKCMRREKYQISDERKKLCKGGENR